MLEFQSQYFASGTDDPEVHNLQNCLALHSKKGPLTRFKTCFPTTFQEQMG